MAANGISTLETKELKQVAKLDLASTNRASSGRPSSYDRDLLPTKYIGDEPFDNENPGGLQPGRPWFTT